MHGQPVNDDAIDFFEIDQGITLRRMVLRNSDPMGTVLFLHEFPARWSAEDCHHDLADIPAVGDAEPRRTSRPSFLNILASYRGRCAVIFPRRFAHAALVPNSTLAFIKRDSLKV
jgi:hypothetical protein